MELVRYIELESWLTNSGKSSTSFEISWNSNSSLSKATGFDFSIKVLFDSKTFPNVF